MCVIRVLVWSIKVFIFFFFKHVQCTRAQGESNSQKASDTDILKITKRTTVSKQRENSDAV